MNNINLLQTVDFTTVILGVFLILFATKEVLEILGYFKGKFHIKTVIDEEKDNIKTRIAILEEHDKLQYNTLKEVVAGIEDIKNSLRIKEEKEREKDVVVLRVQLYGLYKTFVTRGYVDKSGLQTYISLGKIYEEAGGNGIFTQKMKPEVLALPIRDDILPTNDIE